MGEYIALGQPVYGKCYVFSCIQPFYCSAKINNLSSLLAKKLDIFNIDWMVVSSQSSCEVTATEYLNHLDLFQQLLITVCV